MAQYAPVTYISFSLYFQFFGKEFKQTWRRKKLKCERICRIVQFSTNPVDSRSPSCQAADIRIVRNSNVIFFVTQGVDWRYTASVTIELIELVLIRPVMDGHPHCVE